MLNKASWTVLIIAIISASPVNAALYDRGGGIIYDDVLDVSWLQDVNYAQTSGYDANGHMSWNEAVTWVDGLNYYDPVRDITWSDWRLPTIIDSGELGCEWSFSGGDCGYNVLTGSAATTIYSEMASLWYDTLGNNPIYDTNGMLSFTEAGLNNAGPFVNTHFDFCQNCLKVLLSGENGDAEYGWMFSASYGSQGLYGDGITGHVWALRSGDVIAPVPVPGAIWLFFSGLIGFGFLRRNKHSTAHPTRPPGRQIFA